MRLQTVESVLAPMMSVIMTLAITIAGTGSPAQGAVPVIGTVTAKGAFRLDNSTVVGNATLFEGATIETKNAGSRMELASGAKVSLGTESKARFYGDHMILEKGESRLDKADSFWFEAKGLTIQPETGTASARVVLSGGAHVEVAALTGSFRILNARGTLVANIGAGHALDLEPQGPLSGPVQLTGMLRKINGHYLLTDETTNVTVELRGSDLSKEVGHHIHISGQTDDTATPVAEASQVVRVDSTKRLPAGAAGSSGTAAAGKGGAPGGAAGGGGIAGMSVATTAAIIGGVVVAGTLGGLAAAGTLSGGSSTMSR